MSHPALHSVMTDAEYEAAKAEFLVTYGASAREASALRDQALATLFHRSGWTQEKLAAKEGKSQSWVDQRLRFGRFLGFTTTVVNSELPLTEYRFRTEYWEKTAGDERERFREITKRIQADVTLSRSHTPKGHPKRIVDKFADTKWHPLPIIAKHLDAVEDEVERSLAGMVKDGRGGAKTEVKTVGKIKHYRFFKNARMVSSTELTEKLAPIVKGLEEQGRKNMVTMSVTAVAVLAGQLRKLLDEWTE